MIPLDRRKHVRYPVECVGAFSGEKISAPGIILNLSFGGCRSHSTTEFITGEMLEVRIHVPRDQAPLHVDLAVVRWSQGQEFGMEFIQMAPAYNQQLRDVIRATEANRAPGTEHGHQERLPSR